MRVDKVQARPAGVQVSSEVSYGHARCGGPFVRRCVLKAAEWWSCLHVVVESTLYSERHIALVECNMVVGNRVRHDLVQAATAVDERLVVAFGRASAY
eukprot:2780209-Prymnesium_polylepis.4